MAQTGRVLKNSPHSMGAILARGREPGGEISRRGKAGETREKETIELCYPIQQPLVFVHIFILMN